MGLAIKTLVLTTEIPLDRQVHIRLPVDVPPGPAEIVIVVAPHSPAKFYTLGDLAHSEFFGMWADRADISDSVEFACQLRTRAWDRSV